jgi:RND family efflux transporter MFP subunit
MSKLLPSVRVVSVNISESKRAVIRDSISCLAALAVALVAGCDEPVVSEAIRPVRAVKIGDVGVIHGRSIPGQASAAAEVNLAFRVAGPLVQLPVKVGQLVGKGDLLAQIDSTDYRVALDGMQARLDRAKQTLAGMKTGRPEDVRQAEEGLNATKAEFDNAKVEEGRFKKLLAQNASSQSEYDRSVANLDRTRARVQSATEFLAATIAGSRVEDVAAKEAEIRSLSASVENASNQLKYTTLKAPFDGSIASTFVENYQTVQANQLIVRLVDTSELEVTIQVPEQAIHLSKYVKEIACVFDSFPDKTFQGTIKEVGTEASLSTRTYPVTIAIKQEYAAEDVIALPGMTCKVTAQLSVPTEGLGEAVEVPDTAILDDGESTYVWLIDETTKTVSRLPVEVGELTTLGVTVSGPTTGQWIATAGVHYMREGQVVRILDESGLQ